MNVHDLFKRLRLPVGSRLPSFDGATGWLNTAPLHATDLRDKVVAVDFWTFTCINWLRTLPYLRAWHTTYAEHGLVLVGVHTPEFGVEHDVERVRGAARTWVWTTRSRSTTTTPSGTRSRTSTGRRFTSPTSRVICGTTISVKVATTGRRRSSGSS